jgi:hypothetical protein
MFGLTCHQYKPLTEGVLFLCLWNILKESFPCNVVGTNHYKYANIKKKIKMIQMYRIYSNMGQNTSFSHRPLTKTEHLQHITHCFVLFCRIRVTGTNKFHALFCTINYAKHTRIFNIIHMIYQMN